MTSEDKKISEEKESETTEDTLSKTETQGTDPAKSPPQKVKSRSNRFVNSLACTAIQDYLFGVCSKPSPRNISEYGFQVMFQN